jgi:hypothetical protein
MFVKRRDGYYEYFRLSTSDPKGRKYFDPRTGLITRGDQITGKFRKEEQIIEADKLNTWRIKELKRMFKGTTWEIGTETFLRKKKPNIMYLKILLTNRALPRAISLFLATHFDTDYRRCRKFILYLKPKKHMFAKKHLTSS